VKNNKVLWALAITISFAQPACATANKASAGNYSETSASAGQRKAGEVVIEPASLTTPETGTVNFELGTLFVPENRSEPNSRIIGVGFARFRALQPSDTPPTFHLPGGPGGSYLMLLKPGGKPALLGRVLKLINLYRRVSDVVLVDQRGNSERGEVLKFRYRTPEHPPGQPITLAGDTAAFVETARAAVAESAARGIDLRGYTV
jgi:hypothetical protein